MGGKKKKGKKKKETNQRDDDEDKKEVDPDFIVNLPQYGWIRLWLKLCDPPNATYNQFRTIMRSNQSLDDVKKRIVDYHGRIENINLYNTDPYPARNKQNDFKKEPKPRVPPYTQIDKLLKMKKEHDDLLEKKAQEVKKMLEKGEIQKDDEKKYLVLDETEQKRFEILMHFDFPEDLKGGSIVQYDSDKLNLYNIFQEYGTEAKPAVDPKNDPKEPEKKEKELKSPAKKVETEEKKPDDPLADPADPDASPTKVEEEEPEEVFIPPVEKVLWYDFDAYDGKDPVLLALMRIDLEEEKEAEK